MPESKDESLLRKLREIVLSNLDNEDFSVTELSEEAGISRSYLHRKLKQLKGQSVSRFIREIRLKQSLELLLDDSLTTSEIAYKVGFSSPSYFHKCFHDYFGYTPGEMKEMYRTRPQLIHDHILGTTLDLKDIVAEIQQTEKEGTPGPLADKISRKRFSAAAMRMFLTVLLLLAIIITAGLFYFGKKDATKDNSIAVLPLTNLSNEVENRYFADGLAEDLINRLSGVDSFTVISRTSSDRFRDRKDQSLAQIAGELGVNYIVEGSVQRNAEKVRINIQLVDAGTDSQVWGSTYDRDVNDLFSAQSEIAVDIASELKKVLTEAETVSLRQNRTTNLEALEYYQLGTIALKKGTGEGYVSAINHFENAIEADSSFSLAYAGMASVYRIMACQGYIDRRVGREQAHELALNALSFDQSLSEAYTVLGNIYFRLDWDWEKAENAFLQAIDFNPSYSVVHHHYAALLNASGRSEQARHHLNKAQELDPLSFVINNYSAETYFNHGEFEQALNENHKAAGLIADHPLTAWLEFRINYALDKENRALEAFKDYGLITGEFFPEEADSIFQRSGIEGLLQKKISLSDQAYEKALCYAMIDDPENTFTFLNEALRSGTLRPDFLADHFLLKTIGKVRLEQLLEEAKSGQTSTNS